MPDTIKITIPADTPERDRERVHRAAKVARRYAEIRRKYEAMTEDGHTGKEAEQELSDQYPVSARQVRRIVYGC